MATFSIRDQEPFENFFSGFEALQKGGFPMCELLITLDTFKLEQKSYRSWDVFDVKCELSRMMCEGLSLTSFHPKDP